MKIKLLSLFGALILGAFSVSAQSVVITPKKVTYKRPKPSADFKKTFTVNYPKVKAATPALSKKIEAEISYQKNNNLNVQEEIREVQWLEEADYEVIYNDRGILSIRLFLVGSGAYPSAFEKTVVVDLATGSRVTPQSVFSDLEKLAAFVKKAQSAEVKSAIAEIKNNPDFSDVNADEMFENTGFTTENLTEFAVSEKGVTFIYDYNFPHVIKAAEPDGSYFFEWAQLKLFIKRGGLLEKFVR